MMKLHLLMRSLLDDGYSYRQVREWFLSAGFDRSYSWFYRIDKGMMARRRQRSLFMGSMGVD